MNGMNAIDEQNLIQMWLTPYLTLALGQIACLRLGAAMAGILANSIDDLDRKPEPLASILPGKPSKKVVKIIRE